ncbi:hypothetical protein OHT59_08865 [Streptomyces sp. NBC_00243]|uniref:hypothetical protein n=1 Tax=Streptomyces sp. NBC_00243 TaxID=2975688 RepID=UPI002DD7E426|nr:hypothetical protein [Streptomyces sp. NBC_00243]WRZ18594.1 hypothetical protein OHT59_08865 [Streptomyces sp. NBC_00243]
MPPQSSGEPSARDIALEQLVPGLKGLARRKKAQVVGIVLGAAVVGGLCGLLAGFVFETETAKPRVKAEQEAEDALDAEEDPFTSTVDYDYSMPENWKIVLDRPLTENEQDRLTSIHGDLIQVWDYMHSLGGRVLRYPSVLQQAPPGAYDPTGADSTIFNMNLFSNRKSNLSIVDMRAADVTCREPTARTVVVAPPQGEASYAGILYDLTKKNFAPIATDEGSNQGQPYFSRRKIDLGNSESPGGLHVEAYVRDKTCEWKIKAKYRDANQKSGEVTLQDGTKPLVAEAAPTNPEQLWFITVTNGWSWLDCRKVSEDPYCLSWRAGKQ